MVENYRKVSFNIASEASYVYILSRQKFIENAKNGQFCQFLKCDILSNFQTMCTFSSTLRQCDCILVNQGKSSTLGSGCGANEKKMKLKVAFASVSRGLCD